MWWNGRFASWMCSRQICSNCVMLSCQYGPKSQRNVSNTLLNQCHEELRQFWRQKGVQPGTSKVYLIKWPVSVYIYNLVDKHVLMTHTYSIYVYTFIYLYYYILYSIKIYWLCKHNIFVLNIYHVCVCIYIYIINIHSNWHYILCKEKLLFLLIAWQH